MTFTETRDEKIVRLQKMAKEAAEYKQMMRNAQRWQHLVSMNFGSVAYDLDCSCGMDEFQDRIDADMALAAAKVPA